MLKSESIFRTIFEISGTATSVLEPDGTIDLVNRSWEKLHGYSKEEVENKRNYLDLVEPQDQAKFKKYFESLSLHNGSAPYICNARIMGKKGDVINVLLTMSIVQRTLKRVISTIDTTNLTRAREELRTAQALFKVLTRRVGQVREEERHRIARELHDQLSQELAAIKIEAVTLAEQLENPMLSERARVLVNLANSLTDTVHHISTNLRPEMLDRLGLAETVQWFAEDFEHRTGISCPVDIGFRESIRSKESAEAAFRIVQEALTNTSLHARATQARIGINKNEERLVVTIADNGVGMDMSQVNNGTSFGLFGMRERAHIAGGNLNIYSRPGKGTKIVARLPL